MESGLEPEARGQRLDERAGQPDAPLHPMLDHLCIPLSLSFALCESVCRCGRGNAVRGGPKKHHQINNQSWLAGWLPAGCRRFQPLYSPFLPSLFLFLCLFLFLFLKPFCRARLTTTTCTVRYLAVLALRPCPAGPSTSLPARQYSLIQYSQSYSN